MEIWISSIPHFWILGWCELVGKSKAEIEDYQEATEYLDCRVPKDHYFIAIETPVTYRPEKCSPPCYSWGYTQTTWVFVDSLAEIDKYRKMVGKAADATLEEKEDK